MDENDFLNELDEDFASGVESEVEVEGTSDPLVDLERFLSDYKPFLLSRGNPSNIFDVSQVHAKKTLLATIMQRRQDGASALLLSKLQPLIQQEVGILHTLLQQLYEQKFPEMQSIVTSGESYAKLIRLLEQGDDGPLDTDKLQGAVSREQVLVLSMAMQTGFKKDVSLSFEDSQLLNQCVDVLLELSELQQEIKSFVTSLVSQIAPNMCALVGSDTSAALIAAAGGIQELSEIPSCNLASMGMSKVLSHGSNTDQSGVRQQGFVYYCAFIQEQPISVRKQALKMTCAKVSLCARVDFSKSSLDGLLGNKWRQEVISKLQSIQEPPNISNTKALPIPEDKPKKKRAGRRFRKYKQQFQLSHARQLQNRMEFGREESSVTDAFGEEIGMGMAHALRTPTSTSGQNLGTAKLRAPMQQRLATATEDTHEFFSANNDRSSLLKRPIEEPTGESGKKIRKTNASEWYMNLMQESKHSSGQQPQKKT
ncbi:LANO_0G11342g1_1 [Lachancea nothofagi CBS 11611]|uniref:LANO_0G11342g1_1 n=1 Tax=Lachancea nothofagi CBS 11611 TaxID=1266666 RepID=A0A1G4KJ94_9SACH|nr:LANO_0G11342g1_1 [Lachancea nothofagi CBS 11611]